MNRTLWLTLILAASSLTGCAGARYAYYAPGPPPPPRIQVRAIAPGPGFVWIDGYWGYGRGGYAWAPGYWTRPPRPRAVRAPGGWHYRGGRYYYRGGRWR